MTWPRHPWVREYPTHSWAYVLEFFRGCARANAYFAPLHAFAVRLAASQYGSGVFPVQSMHSIRLYQQNPCSSADEFVHVIFDHGEFVVRHVPGSLRPPHTATPAKWERQGPDGFGMLEGCLRHLGWFVEYREAGDTSRPYGSPEPQLS